MIFEIEIPPIHFELNNDILKNNYHLYLITLITNLMTRNKTLSISSTTLYFLFFFFLQKHPRTQFSSESLIHLSPLSRCMNQPLDLAPIAVTANRRIPLDPDYPRSSPETKQEKRKNERKRRREKKRERESIEVERRREFLQGPGGVH